MKRISIALMTLAATLAAVSCQKVFEPKEQPSGQMTITAVAEQVTTPDLTKAEMAYRYDVLWQENDSICVKDASNAAIFKLVKGAGTTKGTFKGGTVTGDVKAYYPASLVNGEKLVWPATQQNSQVAPMFCKKTITTDTEEFNFKSLGATMQIVLTTTVKDITLKSISIKDGTKTMSGEFTVEKDSLAVITATDKAGITLDLGEGVKIGEVAKYFNIAVPAGKYENLTLTFTATDGSKCEMTSTTLPEIKRNVVGRITLCAPQFTGGRLAGALAGEFSIAEGKTVYFSQGNLWYGKVEGAPTATFNFESNQYDSTPSTNDNWNAEHVSHFYWSKTASVAYAQSYDDPDKGATDVFFTNDKETTAKSDFTVNGVTGKYRTLSAVEWKHLFDTRSASTVCGTPNARYAKAMVNGKAGIILLPDTYVHPSGVTDLTKINTGDAAYTANSYDLTAWAEMESAGAVFLPAAGSRDGTIVSYMGGVNGAGYYWSSTAFTETNACQSVIDRDYVGPDCIVLRSEASSVRLVTECKGVDHLPFVAVESISINKDKAEIKVDSTETLTATILPDNATNKELIWTSSDPAVATVDAEGKVTAVAEGTATITAISDATHTATCTVTVTAPALPTGALKGEFTVSNDGGTTKTQIYFSQGNLWYGTVGDAQTATFNFEANQYSSASSWEASHMSHFYWSQSVNSAIAEEYDWNGSADDVFFTNATETTAKEGFTVNVNGKNQSGWRTLSTKEWQYLFNTSARMVNGKACYSNAVSGVSIGGSTYKGVFLYPDNYNGEIVSSSMTWDDINAAGIVFLPAAGYRNGSNVYGVGDYGHYWTSTANDEDYAYFVDFSSPDVTPDNYAYRKYGCSVRLITEVPAK